MKPIFTNYGQSLTETLPGCCGPLARRLSPKPQPKVIKLLKIKIIICDSINLVKIVKEEDYINFSTNNVCCSLHLHWSICDFLSCLYTLIIVELPCRPIWSVLGLGDSACCFYEDQPTCVQCSSFLRKVFQCLRECEITHISKKVNFKENVC